MISTCGDESVVPDFAVLCYPVISFTYDVHQGSVGALLGDDAGLQARRAMDADQLVTGVTPPTFLWHTAEDTSVPMTHSLRYAAALHRAGVPVELHVYPTGGHGLGLAADHPRARAWRDARATWMHNLQ